MNTRFPRLSRSTLNELQQNQHEKASIVCVRVQSPSGLALVPCALSMFDLSGQLRCWITHIPESHTHAWYRIVFGFLFWHPMLVRPAMKRPPLHTSPPPPHPIRSWAKQPTYPNPLFFVSSWSPQLAVDFNHLDGVTNLCSAQREWSNTLTLSFLHK